MERIIKKKGDKLCVKWKEYNNSHNSWIDKKDSKNEWIFSKFPKPKSLGANVKVKLDLSNFATKSDLKNTTGVDTSDFAKKLKSDLANLKSNIDKLDIDRLKSVPSNFDNLKK